MYALAILAIITVLGLVTLPFFKYSCVTVIH